MSSPPSTQTQQQSVGVNQNLEPTDKRNPRRNRNRDHRSINQSDPSGRDETGLDRADRQTTDRRRRPKPQRSIADGPHASPSTPVTSQTDAPSLHPQSDRTVSADPSSASARTPINSRNRLSRPAKGRGIAPHAQDENSASGHSRRAGR